MSRRPHPLCILLIEQRYALRITQVDLAEAIGIQVSRLRDWESGKGHPNMESIEDWATALGFDLDINLVPNGRIRALQNSRYDGPPRNAKWVDNGRADFARSYNYNSGRRFGESGPANSNRTKAVRHRNAS